jgi:hypothetical protein
MAYIYIGIIILFLGAIVVIAMTMDKEDMEK